MAAGVGVEADQIGPRLRKSSRQGVDRLHHQMHIDRNRLACCGFGVRLECLADHGAEGQIGDVMVVHHVKVDPVGTGGDDGLDLLTQAGKVGGKYGGGDAVSHGGIFAVASENVKN